MADIVDPETRSRMMSGIEGKNTKPELALRRALHARGFRYRLHDNKLPGKPDLILPRFRTAIFVHGCFWHRHEDCKYATTPATREEFWKLKFRKNVARDKRNTAALIDEGWKVAVIWECEIKRSLVEVADKIEYWIKSDTSPDLLSVQERLFK